MRPDLRFRRLLTVWAPLAITFLLVTGSTPVVNACINRLPGRIHEIDLAAFALFLSMIVVLHSPLFVAREISMKLSVDRAGARRALKFCLCVAALSSVLEVLIGTTPLGRILLGAFTEREDVVAIAQPAFLYIWPAPFAIAVRAVYQAHQIQHDDTLFVGLGTVVRLIVIASFGFLLAPDLAMSGPVLGAIAIVVGIFIEMVFSVWRGHAVARPPETSTEVPLGLTRFAVPLMFANVLGVLASLFYLRIAALVARDVQQTSLAAFQEIRPLAWMFTAGGFALQSLTTAKIRTRADEAPMVRFSVIVGGALTVALAMLAFVPPLRSWILVDLLGERAGGAVLAFAVPTLMLAVGLPVLQSVRFTLRGILIARGHTRAITLIGVVSLTLIATAISFDLLLTANGAFNAYVIWLGTLAVELVVMLRLIFGRGGPAAEGFPAPVRGPEVSAGG